MSDSTRRAARTAYQVLLAALAIVGVLVLFVDDITATWPQAAAVVVGLAATAGLVTKVLVSLEDTFPQLAWLRGDDTYRLSESTRRALRTAWQTLIAAVTFVAGLVVFLPAITATVPEAAGFITALVAAAAVVSKILNALDNAGIRIPILSGPHKDPAPVGEHELGA